MPTDTGFLPSADGLRFTNDWPAESKVTVLGVPVGSAARGLCGGMVFTALDVFTAGLPPLADGRPGPGTPLFEYIVRRLFDSWNIPGGVLRYYRGMVARTAGDGWPLIRAELDAGRPCPVGLVMVRSANPLLLGRNHLVLAYGYDVSAGVTTMRVYDPNTDLDRADDVRIGVRPGPDMEHNVAVAGPIRGFFRVAYTPADPSRLERQRPSSSK